MAVRSQTYDTVAGETVLNVPELAFREIISVKREGTGFNIVLTGSPGDRDVLYGNTGSFTFLNPFFGAASPVLTDPQITEKIFIIWQE